MHDHCLKPLEETQERMGKYFDRARKELPPYSLGDLVMLNGTQIRTQRAAKKLDAKLFELFKVKKLLGPEGQSVELEIPSRWGVHNVFHTSLVEPYRSSGHGRWDVHIAVRNSGYVDSLSVTHQIGYHVEGNQVLMHFEVQEIMGSHYNAQGNRLLQLIKW